MNSSPAICAGQLLIAELILAGVRDVVVCPGSRSAPLAYAAAIAEAAGLLRVHIRVDERSAGFTALGLSLGSGDEQRAVVPVITTSGTAVGNLLPAAIEAHHSGVPLLLLTADRPFELRATGANQTTAQAGIFAAFARLSVDVPAPTGLESEPSDVRALVTRALAAATGALGGAPGPVHLNLAYRDPLAPPGDRGYVQGAIDELLRRTARKSAIPVWGGAQSSDVRGILDDLHYPDSHRTALAAMSEQPRTLVVAGSGAGPVAGELAAARGWPLLADVTSGALSPRGFAEDGLVARHHLAVPGYRAVLREALGPIAGSPPDPLQLPLQVVVLGVPTLSREILHLLSLPGMSVVAISTERRGGQPWADAQRTVTQVLAGVPASWLNPVGKPSDWAQRWYGKNHQNPAGSPSRELTGRAATEAVLAASRPEDTLVLGSSSAVRYLDELSATRPFPEVIANRGVAGIDGMVSTAIGVAIARSGEGSQPSSGGRVRALVGDLTFLHDVGGLLLGAGEPSPGLQIIVLNDAGGAIFSGLAHGRVAAGGTAELDIFKRIFVTPQQADIAALCAGYRVKHVLVANLDELDDALLAPVSGVEVLEVALPPVDAIALQ